MVNFLSQDFSLSLYESIILNENFKDILTRSRLLEKLPNFKGLAQEFSCFFFHRKHYREIIGIEICGHHLFLKRYLKNLHEACQEWENILLLWKEGFPTSKPVFFYKNNCSAILGTLKIEGRLGLDLIEEEQSLAEPIVKKIAHYLVNFHQKGFFHQDCYLNHFYFDDNWQIHIIDVARVIKRPFLSVYYQIKDLAQLKFSFSYYFAGREKELWGIFWEEYQRVWGKKFGHFFRIGLDLKCQRISSHTKRLMKKAKAKRA